MGRSQAIFNRWGHVHESTWPFRVYKKYNEELSLHVWSQHPIPQFIFKTLNDKSAKLQDPLDVHFKFKKKNTNFSNLAEWKEAYSKFNKWILLNYIIALSSNLETYISSVASLAIESNPGILLGSPKTIDGTLLLKTNSLDRSLCAERIKECTVGEWSKRVANFNKLFGDVPQTISDNIGDLEKLRILRNKIAHAFGRDIEKSRYFDANEILPAETISHNRLIKYLNLTYKVARDIDAFLLDNHIGEFQNIILYNKLYPNFDKTKHISYRAMEFKKVAGRNDSLLGKEFCKGLANYYESIL